MDKEKIFPKGGSIVIFGDIFGDRYGENNHQVIDYRLDEAEKIFHIYFNEGEVCTVYTPKGISYGKTAFVIKDASRITWEWYYYGREKTIENLNKWDYKKTGRVLVLKAESGNLARKYKQIKISMAKPALRFL